MRIKILGALAISGFAALLSDMIYGSKIYAENFMFGIFLNQLMVFFFTIFSILTLVYVMGYILFKELRISRFFRDYEDYTYLEGCDCIRCKKVRASKSKSKKEDKK